MVDGVRTNIMGWESFGYAWYIWVICMLLDDFSYYWFHRQNHMIRFLWAAHIVHHSSDNFNLGTAVRNGWFTIFYKPFFYVWIVIIGFQKCWLFAWVLKLLAVSTHTICKKIGVHREFLNTHTCIKYTTHRILNMDKTMVVFLMFLIEFLGLGNS
jgi:sterol desaturase/sphingolipid hydroxylase (fatty acid hydroxylase superfamily)